jgi:hypothetical protein
MRKILLLLITLSTLTSCALDIKPKKKQKTSASQSPWQSLYYQETVFKLTNPVVVDSGEQLESVCRGPNKAVTKDYQNKEFSSIAFKKTAINIKTKAGFTKKAFITRGVCRELALSKKENQNTGIRKSIKSMNLLYIYNIGTFVVDLTFKTKFSDVEFYIK